jgi:hypothetical protein
MFFINTQTLNEQNREDDVCLHGPIELFNKASGILVFFYMSIPRIYRTILLDVANKE